RNSREGRLHMEVEFDVGMVLLERRFPITAEETVGDVIAAPQADRAAHFLLRLIFRQPAQIPLLCVGNLSAARRHHFRTRRMHIEPFCGFLLLRVDGGSEKRYCDQGNQRLVDHCFRSFLFNYSIFFNCSRTASAVSGKYFPSRMTASCPSRLRM